jgi:predicted enzyme related to lactoylglutathione lyase
MIRRMIGYWTNLQALRVLLTMLALGVMAPSYSAQPAVPSLVTDTEELRPGKFVWIDLFTPDPLAARKFYGALFGWSFVDLGDPARPYTLAYLGDEPVAGIATRSAARASERRSRWVAYMSVPDVAQAADRAAKQGGKVLVSSREVPDRGTMAVLADPDNVPVGLIHSSSGDPPDELAPVGDWIWALYQSLNPTAAAAFYQQLGNYEVVADERFPDREVYLLATAGYARAVVSDIPLERADQIRPDWLYFIRVEDIDATLATATKLGAQVLVAPRPDLLGGRMAAIRDPAGAPLGLMEWQPPTDGEAQ